jgi:uncharacterized protein YjbI with pentapeptide repeats
LTLIVSVVTQIIGFRSIRANTERQIKATEKNTADTLAQQREQLDTTLGEQREQLDRTLGEQRTRTLNERFATAASQLGGDKPPAVQLAGVYAMAVLADDWPENRQTCVDVLCGYLRMPYEPDLGEGAPEKERRPFRASREVRHTVIRVITAHLKEGAGESWQGLNFDCTGVVFDGGDFIGANFPSGQVRFAGAEFSGDKVDFTNATFSGGKVDFSDATFSGGLVAFDRATFSSGEVSFIGATFAGGTVTFRFARFSSGTDLFAGVKFAGAKFSGGAVYFGGAEFSDGNVDFTGAEFSDGKVDFSSVDLFSLPTRFSGGLVDFNFAKFSGGEVTFKHAKFSGGRVLFSGASDWSSPPEFPWTDTPPPGVSLPRPPQPKPADITFDYPPGREPEPKQVQVLGVTYDVTEILDSWENPRRPEETLGQADLTKWWLLRVCAPPLDPDRLDERSEFVIRVSDYGFPPRWGVTEEPSSRP